jgi:hypothetical protein
MRIARPALYIEKRPLFVSLAMGRLGILCLFWAKRPVITKISEADRLSAKQEDYSGMYLRTPNSLWKRCG